MQKTLEDIPHNLESEHEANILDIPKDAEEEFFARQHEALLNENKSADTKLWELAATMNSIQSEGVEDSFGLADSSGGLDTGVLTDADRLVQNATNINQSIPSLVTGEAQTNDKKPTPKARWAKLRAATVAVGAAAQKAKADEEIGLAMRSEDDSLSESSDDSSDVLGNFFKIGAVVKSDLRDFDSWVRLRQKGAFYYARVILLYVL